VICQNVSAFSESQTISGTQGGTIPERDKIGDGMTTDNAILTK